MSFSDTLAIWSLAVSIMGTAITVGGLAIAIHQVIKTRNAAQAASDALEDAAHRMRANYLLVLLPQFHAVEIDLDYAIEGEDRPTARRALLMYSRVASQVAELMSAETTDQSEFIAELRNSAELASQAKGKLAADSRTTVRSAVLAVQSQIGSIASRSAGLSTQFQIKAV